MKPQALQDAIKTAAAKKKTRIDSGWREPTVKQHKLTAEEYAQVKSKRPSVPPDTFAAASGVSWDIPMQKMEQERVLFQREKDVLLAEMKSHREEMKDCRDQMNAMKVEIAGLKAKVEKLESSKSKTLPSNPWPHVQPHSAEKVGKYQARDEALKAFMMKPSDDFYPKKQMSVETVEGTKVVLFKKKLYIPEKLRQKTMSWYFDNYPDASAKLAAHCTWPTQDKDVSEYAKTR